MKLATQTHNAYINKIEEIPDIFRYLEKTNYPKHDHPLSMKSACIQRTTLHFSDLLLHPTQSASMAKQKCKDQSGGARILPNSHSVLLF